MAARETLHKPKARRATSCLAVLLALLYAATSLPWSSLVDPFHADHEDHAGAPASGTGWACAKHACGCKSAEQCALHCCCSKTRGKGTLPEVITLPSPAVDDLLPGERAWVPCSGPSGDPHHLLPGLAPHLFPPHPLAILPGGRESRLAHPSHRILARPASPPFKVPIPFPSLTA